MGKLNTFANISSAVSNRDIARSGAETSASVGKLASSDRHRELRERGLITHRSTPKDIAAVEAMLAAQMRGRMIMQGSKYWSRRPYSLTIGVAAGGVILAIYALGSDTPWMAPVLLIAAAALSGYFYVGASREEERRAKLIARANWNKKGKCRWCAATEPHIVEGEEEHPRVAHAHELEQEIGEPLWVEVGKG